MSRRALLSARLAARYHQSQAEVIRLGSDAARHIRRIASSMAVRAARLAAESVGFDLRRLDRELREMVGTLRQETTAAILLIARRAWKRNVAALLDTLPQPYADALTIAALRGAARKPSPFVFARRTQESLSIRGRDAISGLSAEEQRRLLERIVFAAPTEEEIIRALTVATPDGKGWDDRLRHWTETTRGAFLTEITQGLTAGENPSEIERRLRPLADGLGYKSERIARTECVRVAEMMNLEMTARMGDLVIGQQIVAVMDEWTRPHHAARNGKIYRTADDGWFRDDDGRPMPMLPDEPNCRCMTIPVMRAMDDILQGPTGGPFRTATNKLIPDPSSYADWWARAPERERKIAVGAKRYNVARNAIGAPPDWEELIDVAGRLVDPEILANETPEQRRQRVDAVRTMLAQLRAQYGHVMSRGFTGT